MSRFPTARCAAHRARFAINFRPWFPHSPPRAPAKVGRLCSGQAAPVIRLIHGISRFWFIGDCWGPGVITHAIDFIRRAR